MIFRLDFKIYTKNQDKINNKISGGNFQRDFSRKLLQKSGDNLLKKSRKKIFSFVFGKFVELTLFIIVSAFIKTKKADNPLLS